MRIYLNDHLGGSTFGVEIVRHAAGESAGTRLGAFLARLATEIEEDRPQLRLLMEALDVVPNPAKVATGWAAEKARRLKPDGLPGGSSSLGRVLDLEAPPGRCEGSSVRRRRTERILDSITDGLFAVDGEWA